MRRLLKMSEQYVDQTPGRGAINGLQHALRTAAMGVEQGLHEDTAFIGLVHDLARPLNDVHHGELMAEMVRDRVSREAYMVIKTHGKFQSAIVHDTKTPYQEADWFKIAAQLAGFELRSFSADYDGPDMTVEEADELLVKYLGD
jgi:hypothetical protein